MATPTTLTPRQREAADTLANAVRDAIMLGAAGHIVDSWARPLAETLLAYRSEPTPGRADALADMAEAAFVRDACSDPTGAVGRALFDYAAERTRPRTDVRRMRVTVEWLDPVERVLVIETTNEVRIDDGADRTVIEVPR